MSDHSSRFSRWFWRLVLLAVVAWGGYSVWALDRVRSTGEQLRETLHQRWPSGGAPQPGERERLLSTANRMAEGRFLDLGRELAPFQPPTVEQRALAAKFLEDRPELRRRLLGLTAAAREAEADGTEVASVREALGRAVRAAVDRDERLLADKLDLAERGLEAAASGVGLTGPADAGAVGGLVVAMEPSYQLSRELMTEGNAAAEKVLVLAAKDTAAGRHADAAIAIRLAGELLGAPATAGERAEIPEWFTELAEREIPRVESARAAAAVELAGAMAAAEAPHESISLLVSRARRRLDTGDVEVAAWWARIALNAMGMSDEAVAAATEASGGDPAGE